MSPCRIAYGRKMTYLMRGALALILLLGGLGFADAQRDRSFRDQFWYPIIGDDGQRVANHPVSTELSKAVDQLPGVVIVGNPRGDITLVEFYDLNCPYCRIAATDVADMVETDSDLRLVLVPFPVLGVTSIEAARVELAVAKLATPQQFYDFHRQIYSRRGVVDAERALAVARGLNLDETKLLPLADSAEITDAMKAHLKLGNALGLAATPAFVIKGVAISGHPGRRALQAIVDSVRSCDKPLC